MDRVEIPALHPTVLIRSEAANFGYCIGCVVRQDLECADDVIRVLLWYTFVDDRSPHLHPASKAPAFLCPDFADGSSSALFDGLAGPDLFTGGEPSFDGGQTVINAGSHFNMR